MQTITDELHLKTGTWLAGNCGDMPSESHCQLVMMAPAEQRQDLIDAGVTHAVQKHGHEDTPELRLEMEKDLRTIEV